MQCSGTQCHTCSGWIERASASATRLSTFIVFRVVIGFEAQLQRTRSIQSLTQILKCTLRFTTACAADLQYCHSLCLLECVRPAFSGSSCWQTPTVCRSWLAAAKLPLLVRSFELCASVNMTTTGPRAVLARVAVPPKPSGPPHACLRSQETL